MKTIMLLAGLVMLAAGPCRAEPVRIGGVGSMIPLMTALGNAYMKKHPQDTVEVLQNPMGQSGAITALNQGTIEIAMTAMDLTPEQLKLRLEPYEIARMAGVVAVSREVTVSSLTSRQLCDIYDGRIKNWKQVGGADLPIAAMTRPESDPIKAMFRKAFACMGEVKESTAIPSFPRAYDLYRALGSSRNAIGPVDAVGLHFAGGKFKEIRIDGRNHALAGSGKWPYVIPGRLVLGSYREGAVRRFMEFVRSREGREIIRKEQAVPVPFRF